MTSDWRQSGACVTADPDRFFQDTGRPTKRLTAICHGCPALIPCTFDALRRNDLGYQAGLAKAERDRIRRWDKQAKRRIAEAERS